MVLASLEHLPRRLHCVCVSPSLLSSGSEEGWERALDIKRQLLFTNHERHIELLYDNHNTDWLGTSSLINR